MRLPTAVSVIVLSLATVGPVAAGDAANTLDLSLPLSLLSGVDGTFSLTCSASDDPDTQGMIGALQRKGSRGTWTSRDDETRIEASRRGRRFRLRSWEGGSKRLDLKMPWPIAECLFGGRNGESFDVTVESVRAHGGLHLQLAGEHASVGVSLN